METQCGILVRSIMALVRPLLTLFFPIQHGILYYNILVDTLRTIMTLLKYLFPGLGSKPSISLFLHLFSLSLPLSYSGASTHYDNMAWWHFSNTIVAFLVKLTFKWMRRELFLW